VTTQAVPSQIEKLIALFKASPAKSSIVTGLMVIMIVAWARLLCGGKTSAPSAQASIANTTGVSIHQDKLVVHRDIASDSHLRQWADQPVKHLTRNPFVIPLDSYPHDGSKLAAETGGTGYWNLVRKSLVARADQQEQRQILVDNVRIAAGSLKLQSTIMGATRGAMLNGQVVREGSTVAGFHVLRIESRQVIVEREGVRLALLMD
jgi:hypothetical protein